MKLENQNYKPCQVVVEKMFFGHLYHLTLSFSPPPPDIRKATMEAEVLAERMVRDARVRELIRALSPTQSEP